MSDLVDFSRSIQQALASASREPHWEHAEAQRYMAKVGDRQEHFEQLASSLDANVIRPRLEALANFFPNASITAKEPPGQCVCWFWYCERFPASTRVTFSVEHDVRYEKVAVRFEVFMMPVFIKFDQHDKLTIPLGEVDEETVADWVETSLLEFLETYLRIDRGGPDLDEAAVIDPVCGMRILEYTAEAQATYRGHPYYFCSAACESKFSRNPTAFVEVTTH